MILIRQIHYDKHSLSYQFLLLIHDAKDEKLQQPLFQQEDYLILVSKTTVNNPSIRMKDKTRRILLQIIVEYYYLIEEKMVWVFEEQEEEATQ